MILLIQRLLNHVNVEKEITVSEITVIVRVHVVYHFASAEGHVLKIILRDEQFDN